MKPLFQPKSSAKGPQESLKSPRSRTYEKPWLKNSTGDNLHSSMPRPTTTSRPKTPKNQKSLSKTVDLTVKSREASRDEDFFTQLKKVDKNEMVQKEVKKNETRIINLAKVHGIPHYQGICS